MRRNVSVPAAPREVHVQNVQGFHRIVAAPSPLASFPALRMKPCYAESATLHFAHERRAPRVEHL